MSSFSKKETALKKLILLILPLLLLVSMSQGIQENHPNGTEDCLSCPDAQPVRGCTDILVGKKASADGSVITVHTADCGVCDWTWHHIPAADHKPGAVRKIYHIDQVRTWPPETGGKWVKYKENDTGVEIPQVPHTYSYFHSVFGYMNEHQLAVTESTIGCQPKMRNPTPSAVMDITTLTMLSMERCRTAREAVKMMGSLAEQYGYGYHDSGEMLGVADAKEVWLFEIMPVGPLWTPKSGKPGAVWCAQRVPDDHVSFCPNESRIGEIDLTLTDYYLASPNAVSLAVDMGFFDPKSGESFSWKKAYSPTEGSAADTQARRGRLWRLFDMVAPSQGFSPDVPNMDLPFSVKPDKPLSVSAVMAMTRDKYQGTEYDPARGILGGPFKNPNYFSSFQLEGESYNGPRCISVPTVEYTTLTQSRDWLPDPIGGLVWVSFGSQDTSCFIPLYAGMTRLPESFGIGDHFVFNRKSARWAFDYVDFHTQVMYIHALEDVRAEQVRWESEAIERIPHFDRLAAEIYAGDPEKALRFLTDTWVTHAESLIQAWWDLGDALLVKYNHFRMYNPETRRTGRIVYPEEWKKAIVANEKLKPQKKR